MLVSFTRIGGCLFSFSRIVIRTLYLSNSGQAIPSTFGKKEISETPYHNRMGISKTILESFEKNGIINLHEIENKLAVINDYCDVINEKIKKELDKMIIYYDWDVYEIIEKNVGKLI